MKEQFKLLVASKNRKKIKELKEILEPAGIKVLTSEDVGGLPDIIEDGNTFEENAAKKAVEIARLTDNYVFADDSGLEVEALNNAPGIYSARYAGEGASDKDRVDKLLKELGNKNNRKARFVCVIAISDSKGNSQTFRGEVYGKIIVTPKGCSGFGYDPIFLPDGYDKTFAELESEIKNKISHRGNALRKAYSGLIETAKKAE